MLIVRVLSFCTSLCLLHFWETVIMHGTCTVGPSCKWLVAIWDHGLTDQAFRPLQLARWLKLLLDQPKVVDIILIGDALNSSKLQLYCTSKVINLQEVNSPCTSEQL